MSILEAEWELDRRPDLELELNIVERTESGSVLRRETSVMPAGYLADGAPEEVAVALFRFFERLGHAVIGVRCELADAGRLVVDLEVERKPSEVVESQVTRDGVKSMTVTNRHYTLAS